MRKTILLFTVLLWSTTFAAWQPVETPIRTQWAQGVTPLNVWQEYPRPQMERSQWKSLNGLWDFTVTDRRVSSFPSYDRKILVPFAIEAPLSGIGEQVSEKQALWYRRTVSIPNNWQGKRMLLHIEASDWKTTVWINGNKVGEHLGGYDPFSFDITDVLNDQAQQNLVIRVWDPGNTEYKSVGKQKNNDPATYELCSGLWQTVWLEPVSQSYITAIKMTSDVDKGQLVIQANVNTPGQALSAIIPGAKVIEQTATSLVMQFENPHLWSPEDPYLYPVTLSWGEDTIRSYIGLRKIERKQMGSVQRILLNGKEIFQFGPLDQSYWPQGALTPPSNAAMKWELDYLKEIGCNMVRLHIKRNPRRWYTYCDQLGLLVWQDFINGGKKAKGKGKASAQESEQWLLEQKRMMDTLHNHPAVVMWIVFNEAWGQHDTERIGQWAVDYDSSRLISIASGWTDLQDFGDIRDMHDYTMHPSIPIDSESKRAIVLGEFGGINSVVANHNWHRMLSKDTKIKIKPINGRGGGMWPNEVVDDECIIEYKRPTYTPGKVLGDHLAVIIDELCLLKSHGLCGAVYTQLTDMKHEQNGWLSFDRVEKVNRERLQQMHERLINTDYKAHSLLGDSAWETVQSISPKFKQRLRKQFNLSNIPAKVALEVYLAGLFGRESNICRVYLNRTLIHDSLTRHKKVERRMEAVILRPQLKALLKTGENVLHVDVRFEFTSERYLDVDLVNVK